MKMLIDGLLKLECALLGGALMAVWALPAAWAQRSGNMMAFGGEWILIVLGAAVGWHVWESRSAAAERSGV